MKKLQIILISFLCGAAAGSTIGIYVYNRHILVEHQSQLIQSQHHLDEARFKEAFSLVMAQIEQSYQPFSPLDTLAWANYCQGDKSIAGHIWLMLANFHKTTKDSRYEYYRRHAVSALGIQIDKHASGHGSIEHLLECPQPGA